MHFIHDIFRRVPSCNVPFCPNPEFCHAGVDVHTRGKGRLLTNFRVAFANGAHDHLPGSRQGMERLRHTRVTPQPTRPIFDRLPLFTLMLAHTPHSTQLDDRTLETGGGEEILKGKRRTTRRVSLPRPGVNVIHSAPARRHAHRN